MQLVCVNAWMGLRLAALTEFIKKSAPETDIFCFQEVYSSRHALVNANGEQLNLLELLSRELPGFRAAFHPKHLVEQPALSGVSVPLGNAIFVRTTIPTLGSGGFFPIGKFEHAPDEHRFVGTLQFEKLQYGSGTLLVVNVHGMSEWPKGDSQKRLEQSLRIHEYLARETGPRLMCGDFNTFPDTESIRLVGQGLVNQVQKFGVTTTRSEINRQLHQGKPMIDTISDYMFTSPDITVASLEAPELEVSDHLPLIVNFSLPKLV